MVFIISLLTAILFVLLFEKPLKKNPIPFYVISTIISLALIILRMQGVNPGGFMGKYIYPMFSRAALSTALFVLVMYAVTFKNGSEPIKLLMPLRGQLSIIASILALGHLFSYSRLFSPQLSPAYILSVIMVCIMIPLFVTSFIKIRRKMKAKTWKNLQRFAYIFYVFLYFHILFLYVRGAMHSDSRSTLNVLVYSIVFLWYFICRPLKAYSVKHKDFDLNRYRYISFVLVAFVSLGLYGFLQYTAETPRNLPSDKLAEAEVPAAAVPSQNTDANTLPEEQTLLSTDSGKETADKKTVTDGVYSATCFGYAGDVTVEITVENGKVVSISLPNYEDEADYKHFSDDIVDKLMQDPLADVDAISEATFSTQAVIDAYNEALEQAGIEKNNKN